MTTLVCAIRSFRDVHSSTWFQGVPPWESEVRNHVGSGALHHVVQEYSICHATMRFKGKRPGGSGQCWHGVNKEYHHVNGGGWSNHMVLWSNHMVLWSNHMVLWSNHMVLWSNHMVLWSNHMVLWGRQTHFTAWPLWGGTTWTGDLKCREVKTGFANRDQCKPVLLRLSLAVNLEKPVMSLYGTEWRERGFHLWSGQMCKFPYNKKDDILRILMTARTCLFVIFVFLTHLSTKY
jgi:hypothetical protein